jgi:hypothetical protein
MTDYIASNPAYSLSSNLITFDEAVERVLDVFGVQRSARNERNAVRAVMEAYGDMPQKYDWSYLRTKLVLKTNPTITTGTAAYDHTGNVLGERIITFSTGTLPASAELYSLVLDSVHYEIEKRIDDTHVQLTERSNPGADVAATTFTLYQDGYLVPLDCQGIGRLYDVALRAPIDPASPDDALLMRQSFITGQPRAYSFRSLPRRMAAMAIYFTPIPSSARSYEALYMRRPRPLTVVNYSTGTLSVTSGSTSVTASGTTLTQRHVGTVVRFGTSALAPTPLAGGLSDGTPFLMERIVKSVESATAFTLDAAADADFSAVKFTMSSPIDIVPEMESYFYRECESQYAIIEHREDKADFIALASNALREARGADNRNQAPSRVVYGPLTLADVASSVTP